LDENLERVIFDAGLGEDFAVFQDVEIARSKTPDLEGGFIMKSETVLLVSVGVFLRAKCGEG